MSKILVLVVKGVRKSELSTRKKISEVQENYYKNNTSKFKDSITSKNTSFFRCLMPSERHETALVTAIGGRI